MAVIGVDIGGSTITAGLVENGDVSDVITEELVSAESADRFMEHLFDMIDRLGTDGVDGIGLATPGILDLSTGTVLEIYHIPALKGMGLRSAVSNRYGITTVMNNDANCFALAEHTMGAGKNVDNLAALIIGTGFGAGLILNGRLYSGQHCGAGEFETLVPGNVFGSGFEETYGRSARDVFTSPESPEVSAIADEYGRSLARALEVVVYSVDPELIVLGGSISKANHLFRDAMMQSLEESLGEHVPSRGYDDLRIVFSGLEYPGVLGAAALVTEGYS